MKKLLVVDDSGVARLTVKQYLKVSGYEVFEASNGPQALETIQSHQDLALVLIDYSMPIMNGLTLAKEIRKAFPTIQLAFLSAHPSGAMRNEAKAVGAIFWALKSMSGTQLAKLVSRYIDTPVDTSAPAGP